MAQPQPTTRVRRKAGNGLAALPTTEDEWLAAATKHITTGRLANLCSQGRFSASTAPKEAFLTIRCIWPSLMAADCALGYIVDTGSYFKKKHESDAANLIKRKLLGLDKLDTLYDIICTSGSPRTPKTWQRSIADELGPFSMLVALKIQLQDETVQSALLEDDYVPPTRAPKAANKQWTLSERPSAQLPVPTPPLFRSAKRSRADTMGTVSQGSTSTPSQPPSAPPSELTDDIIPALTHTENLVVAFMVNFLASLASLVQPLSYRPVCVAHSDERTIYFGPIDPTRQTTSYPAQFGARIDGCIPHSIQQGSKPREVVIFEAKRADRNPKDVTVRVQQSMEHAAYIWDRHRNDQTRQVGTYHTFMVAQDCLSLHISVGTYNNDYLDYIFGPGDTPVIPQGGNACFLKIQEFGPFFIDSQDDMQRLVQIMLSLLLWQLELTPKGVDLIKEALSP